MGDERDVRPILHGGAVMPNGNKWTNHCYAQMQRFTRTMRAELFAAARRPVDSISEAHVEWLREQMVLQNRLYREIKSHHDDDRG